MKNQNLPLVFVLVLASTSSLVVARPSDLDITPLNNKDVLSMVQKALPADVIIKTIKSSPCTFDTFPPVLLEMKRRGVPNAVLQAMLEAPYGPSLANSSKDDLGQQAIYHYADQLKQMGLLNPTLGRSSQFIRRENRARASRIRR